MESRVDAGAAPRIVIVGTSGAGKTKLARQLAQRLGVRNIELDELFWGPNWTPKPDAEFRRLVTLAAEGEAWVADGNYLGIRALLWTRATLIVWLNYGLLTTLWRGARRTAWRSIRGAELWHGNRESVRRSFFSRESILVWIVTTFHRRRRELDAMRASGAFPHLTWREFRRPAETARWVASLRKPSTDDRGIR